MNESTQINKKKSAIFKNFLKAAFFLIMSTVLFSCSEGEDDEEFQMPEAPAAATSEITFTADYALPQDDGLSKNVISGSKVLFEPGQQVAIFSDADSDKNCFTTVIAAQDSSTANFVGTIDTTGVSRFYAALPFSAVNSCENGLFSVKVSSEQTAYQNTADPSSFVMVAASEPKKYSFHFLNVCSFLKFTTTDEFSSVVMESADNTDILTATATVNKDAQVTECTSDISSKVTLKPQGSSLKQGTYYIAILPCTMEKGFSLTFTRADGSKLTKKCTKSITFKRAGCKNFGTITDNNNYFYITFNEAATLSLNNVGGNKPSFQFSLNSCYDSDFSDLPSGGYKVPAGTTVYLRGNNPDGLSSSKQKYSTIQISKDNLSYSFGGNIMSLVDNSGETSTIPQKSSYCFYRLFYNAKWLTTAPELPATTLVSHCYDGMFRDCTSLVNAPYLPASNLVDGCYNGMFYGCDALKYIKVAFTKWVDGCTEYWLAGPSGGKFYGPSSIGTSTWSTKNRGDSKIPLTFSFTATDK